MSKSQHTEAQMIGALKQLEAGRKAEDVAREVGVSKHTIYAWKAKYVNRLRKDGPTHDDVRFQLIQKHGSSFPEVRVALDES